MGLVLAVVGLVGTSFSPVWADSLPLPKPLDPAHLGLPDRDEAFSVHLEYTRTHNGYDAAFKEVQEAYTKHPRPHLKAVYGDYLLHGQSFGAPKDMEKEGLALVEAAEAEGSIHATAIMGWEHLMGSRAHQDVTQGVRQLQRAASLGDSQAYSYLAQAFLIPVGLPLNLRMADIWAKAAADQGYPEALLAEAHSYEAGKATPKDLKKACGYYLQAVLHSSSDANDSLKRLAAAGNPWAKRALSLLTLYVINEGQARKGRAAIEFLQANYPKDPEVLCAIGLAYTVEVTGLYSPKQAWIYLDQAVTLGSDDAAAYLAYMTAEGIVGTKRDVAKGLEMLKPLLDKNNAVALNLYAGYHYWGLHSDDQVPKDEALAYRYCVKAWAAGSPYAAANLERCYGFGIGVPKDYALAAKFEQIAGCNGSVDPGEAGNQVLKYLAFVDWR